MEKFHRHVFISYAHLDNQPLTPEQEGWITRFHDTFEALLSMRLGKKAEIWRDSKLQGNDVFAREIVEQFKDTALMITVLTPRYIHSEWCTRELQEFCNRAEQTGGLMVENKSRVLKVVKTPVDSTENLPEIIRDVLGYDFYVKEGEAPIELDPEYGPTFEHDYNRKVAILAYEAKQLINKLESDGDDGIPEPQEGEKGHPETDGGRLMVYLAECSFDQREAREKLEADLKLQGYEVLPYQHLPLEDEAAFIAAVRPLLEQSCLSVHLIGTKYGAVPDGPSQKSTAELQNELAAQRSKAGALQRVIWLPLDTHSEQEPQQSFIEMLHNDPRAQAGADLITGGLEELKTTIYGKLKKLERPSPEESEPAAAGINQVSKLVYLIAVEKDRKATVPLRRYLQGQGLEVRLPAFSGDARTVREADEELLGICDAVLIFYGGGDEAWERDLKVHLKKMAAYRQGKPMPAIFTYLAEPRTADKEDKIDMAEPHLIDGLAGFDEASIGLFMSAVMAAEV